MFPDAVEAGLLRNRSMSQSNLISFTLQLQMHHQLSIGLKTGFTSNWVKTGSLLDTAGYREEQLALWSSFYGSPSLITPEFGQHEFRNMCSQRYNHRALHGRLSEEMGGGLRVIYNFCLLISGL